jgi:hypothetical protein
MFSFQSFASLVQTRKSEITILFSALFLRLAVSPFLAEIYDTSVWLVPVELAISNQGLYSNLSFSYPPLWPYTYLPFVWLVLAFLPPSTLGVATQNLPVSFQDRALAYQLQFPAYISSPIFLFCAKFPLIIGDVALGVVLYLYVRSQSTRAMARNTMFLWMFNPMVFVQSSIHGAYDILPALFSFLSMLMLFQRKYKLSAVFIAVAIGYKLYGILYIPLYIYTILTDLKNKKIPTKNIICKLLGNVGVMFGIVLAIFLPVFNQNMLHALLFRERAVGQLGETSPWSIVYVFQLLGFQSVAGYFVSVSSTIEPFAQATGFALSIIFSGYKINFSREQRILASYILATASAYVGTLLVQPQYIIWILPFILLYSALHGSLRFVYYLLSFGSVISYMLLVNISIFVPAAVFFKFPNPDFLFPLMVDYSSLRWISIPSNIVNILTGVTVLFNFEIVFPSRYRLSHLILRKFRQKGPKVTCD